MHAACPGTDRPRPRDHGGLSARHSRELPLVGEAPDEARHPGRPVRSRPGRPPVRNGPERVGPRGQLLVVRRAQERQPRPGTRPPPATARTEMRSPNARSPIGSAKSGRGGRDHAREGHAGGLGAATRVTADSAVRTPASRRSGPVVRRCVRTSRPGPETVRAPAEPDAPGALEERRVPDGERGEHGDAEADPGGGREAGQAGEPAGGEHEGEEQGRCPGRTARG
jgi:hypothetical protein